MTNSLNHLVLALSCLLGFAIPCGSTFGSVLITLEEVGSDVQYSGSGQLDLAGLTNDFGYTENDNSSEVVGGRAYLANMVPTDVLIYEGFSSSPSHFGISSAPLVSKPNAATGDYFLIYHSNEGFPPGIGLASDYSSNDPLNFAGAFAGESFASLGLVEGSYTWTWSSDSVTVQIVPEPTTAVSLIGAGLMMLLGRLRRVRADDGRRRLHSQQNGHR